MNHVKSRYNKIDGDKLRYAEIDKVNGSFIDKVVTNCLKLVTSLQPCTPVAQFVILFIQTLPSYMLILQKIEILTHLFTF